MGAHHARDASAPRDRSSSSPSGRTKAAFRTGSRLRSSGQSVDFTTNHSWWQNDSILWDSLAAKQPGEAMLIQETGLQRELNLDETRAAAPGKRSRALRAQSRDIVYSRLGRHRMAVEHELLHDGGQRNSDRRACAPTTPRSRKPRCCAISPNSRRRCRQHLARSATAVRSRSSRRKRRNIQRWLMCRSKPNERAVRALAYYAHLHALSDRRKSDRQTGLAQAGHPSVPQALTENRHGESLMKYVERWREPADHRPGRSRRALANHPSRRRSGTASTRRATYLSRCHGSSWRTVDGSRV